MCSYFVIYLGLHIDIDFPFPFVMHIQLFFSCLHIKQTGAMIVILYGVLKMENVVALCVNYNNF